MDYGVKASLVLAARKQTLSASTIWSRTGFVNTFFSRNSDIWAVSHITFLTQQQEKPVSKWARLKTILEGRHDVHTQNPTQHRRRTAESHIFLSNNDIFLSQKGLLSKGYPEKVLSQSWRTTEEEKEKMVICSLILLLCAFYSLSGHSVAHTSPFLTSWVWFRCTTFAMTFVMCHPSSEFCWSTS